MSENLVTTNDVQVTMGQLRILHFSDGVEEEIKEDHCEALNTTPDISSNVDPKTLTWGPWLSHYAYNSGNKLLNAIDYAGEGLANFFGITTPKYQLEIEEYQRMQEEKKRIEEESAGWVQKADGQIPLVLEPPSHSVDRPTLV